MKLLVDADYIVYNLQELRMRLIGVMMCFILVISKFSEALNNVQRELSKIKRTIHVGCSELVLFFSDFEFQEKIYPEYKGHEIEKAVVTVV